MLNRIKRFLANRSSEKKVSYLRKQGAKIGEGTRLLCHTNSFGSEPYLIKVGKDCFFSDNVLMTTHDGGVKVLNSLDYFGGTSADKVAPIVIGDNCFIGNGAKILPGVTIGNNVIIGTGSVVTKDIPDNIIAAGVPAKPICTIDEFYQKNRDRFYSTGSMNYDEKKKYLTEKIKF